MAEAKLLISGPTESKTVRLDPKGVSLGRGSNCDIILEDANVSRVHAWVSQDPFGRWIVEDMGFETSSPVIFKLRLTKATITSRTARLVSVSSRT